MNSIVITRRWFKYFRLNKKAHIADLAEITNGNLPTQNDIKEFFASWLASREQQVLWEEKWDLPLLRKEFQKIAWPLMTKYILATLA